MKKEELLKEKKYLEKTISLLKRYVELNEKKVISTDQGIKDIKKYIWQNISGLDKAEMSFLSNEALAKRSAGKLIYNKNLLYKKMLGNPYFGRVDFLNELDILEEKLYIGLSSLIDEDFKIYVYDWRAPISSLFYDYEIGPASYNTPEGLVKGNVNLKRQYKIEDGCLKYAFDSSLNINDEILQGVLSRGATTKMKNIVSTIQKEQNKVIRNIENDCLIVEGPAGSGKTSVALHRIAFLLYKFRDKLYADETLIFSPNDVFSDYIGDVLPELGERNVLYTSFSDYINSYLHEYLYIEEYMDFIERIYDLNDQELKDIINIKMNNNFIDLVDNYIEEIKDNITFKDIFINNKIIIKKEKLEDEYKKNKNRLPIYQVIERLIDYALMKHRHQTKKLYDEKEIKKRIDEQFTYPRDFKELYLNMYNNKNFKEDFLLLEEKIDVEDFCNISKRKLQNKKILYEDAIIFAYFKGKLLGFPKDRRIKQVVIDEAQDYTKLQYIIMKNVFNKAQFTILGDANQVVNPLFEYKSLEEITSVFKDYNVVNLKLQTTYRNTYEITSFSNKILDLNNVNPINRHGETPELIEKINKREAVKKINNSLNEDLKEEYQSIAVITKDKKDAKSIMDSLKENQIPYYSYISKKRGEARVLVLPIYYAKGLEFDSVIVYDSAKSPYTNKEKKAFYVACTRALHKLRIISENMVSEDLVKGGFIGEKALRKTRSKNH